MRGEKVDPSRGDYKELYDNQEEGIVDHEVVDRRGDFRASSIMLGKELDAREEARQKKENAQVEMNLIIKENPELFGEINVDQFISKLADFASLHTEIVNEAITGDNSRFADRVRIEALVNIIRANPDLAEAADPTALSQIKANRERIKEKQREASESARKRGIDKFRRR
jgi:ATP-dependent helicase YprA (DUF1998 family)